MPTVSGSPSATHESSFSIGVWIYMDIGQMAPTRDRKDAESDDGRRWIYKWMNTSGALVHFDTHKLAVRWPSQDRRQAPLPCLPRPEDGSVYIRMLYNRNNTTDLSKWRIDS